MRIFIYGKDLSFDLKVKEVKGLNKFKGLIGKNLDTYPLFFRFNRAGKHAIHSKMVNICFLAVFLDEDHQIVDVKYFYPSEGAYEPEIAYKSLVEIPMNRHHRELIGEILEKW